MTRPKPAYYPGGAGKVFTITVNMSEWFKDPVRTEKHLKIRAQQTTTDEGFQMYIAWCPTCDEWYLEDGTYTEHTHEKEQPDD